LNIIDLERQITELKADNDRLKTRSLEGSPSVDIEKKLQEEIVRLVNI
jgi:hypothetical protein